MNRSLDSLGRFVIPAEIRKKLDIHEEDTLSIEVVENKIVLYKECDNYEQRIEKAIDFIKDLYDVKFTNKDKNIRNFAR